MEGSKEFLLKQFDKQLYRIIDNDFEKIKELYRKFHDRSREDLIKMTYQRYP
ncbi:hypothetical protein AGMMS5026_08600 [Endomicrobiia bacterium]|uniref:hypothetical protein n=1 Tax=Endomicrobium trichonymphae TaxID=1408204 RepID=UPI00221ADC3D|nr:hypothetical protein AGMMS49523_01630 [Endomicrobiia bacterium]GMO53664.1 MAG: hypothetical protein Ta2C_05560 [Candidatus Endomicrobium trichonymphae]GHT10264.1 hypothetical protein AGMMS49532_09850 [Endomicrobiia bacterium]GHT13103.1 hypothetical protein AGMMS49571_06210 [Endomicrobiia bacterium]GHT20176.1 hypothetical protein AGMMS49929_05850 [Endomicrobiia bacterium]